MNRDALVGMLILLGAPLVMWGLLNGLKGAINKTPTQKGYAAFKKNVPMSNNPYLKPIAEIEDMDAAELWFSGYITAEKESKGQLTE